jgi:outer membrane protein assembly factor BamB
VADPTTAYTELRLRIERGPRRGSYRIVASGPSGETTGPFKLPFSKVELENFILKVGATRQGVRRIESPEMELCQRFGSKLFEALLDGKVGEVYRASYADARAAGRGLRITLSLTDTPELLQVPWEYLYDPPGFLAISSWTPIVRYLDLPKPRRPLEVALPIRILGVVSAPLDAKPIDVGLERHKVETALATLMARGAIAIDWLEEASLAALQRQLRKADYHVFHYIGHGGYDTKADDGVLLFEDEQGRGRPVTGVQLGTILGDEVSLRLAVLNSCEGGRTSLQDPFSGVASSLVQWEVPAVIGMQFEITDRAAILFATEFYAALADGLSVDTAVAEGRRAIYADHNDIEWGTPVLFMRVADGRLFDVAPHEPVRPAIVPPSGTGPMAGPSDGTPVPPVAPGAPVVPVEPVTPVATAAPTVAGLAISRRTLLRGGLGVAALGAVGVVGAGLWALSRRGPTGPIWTFETGNEVYSSPAVVGGVVYIGSMDQNLYAIDAATGAERWRHAAGGAVSSSPAVADGVVYFGCNDGRLYAIDAVSGERRWTFQTGAIIHSSPAVDRGVVYVGSRDNNVYAVDTLTAEERWRFTGGDWFNSSPSVFGDTVYIGCRDQNIYALDTADGTPRWGFPTESTVDSSAAVSEGAIWIGADDHKVRSLGTGTGNRIWEFTAGGGVVSTPHRAGDVLYVGSDDGNLYALDTLTGRERWRLTTGNGIRSTPTTQGGLVYVGSRDRFLYAADAATGELRWRFETGAPIDDSSPAVVEDRVFIGGLDHRVYALDATTGAGA